ncbi:MAG: nucleotide exchange factor GrpE [Rikenellaceae bacterium]
MSKTKTTENQETTATNEFASNPENSSTKEQTTPQEEQESDNMADDCQSGVQEWQDKYMRLSAEFDNFRKRTLREKADLAEYGGAGVLKLMLSTLDDFQRAMQHITDENSKAGVELIYNKFLSSLESQGVKEMELVGKPFDVDFAEAIAKMPAPSPEQSGCVMDVAERGYMLKDKVLRFAKVVVFE